MAKRYTYSDLEAAIETYNTTPARHETAVAIAKARVTRIKNAIAKQEAEVAKPAISFTSSTPRSARNRINA